MLCGELNIRKAQGKKESTAAAVATEMSHAHNIMIRGINSMLLQAPFISRSADIRDFVEYAHALYVVIHEHHGTEEVLYFPLVEEASGVPGIMQKNVVQHEEFMPKLHDFDVYAMQIKIGTKKYDSEKFVELINGFAPLLVRHLTDEIEVLMELEKFDIDWTPINKKMTQYATEHASRVYLDL
jgi:hemerythrin-like domain-containing protein